MKLGKKTVQPADREAMILAAQAGDLNTRNTLIEQNMPLIYFMVKKIVGTHGDVVRENLSAGVLGFIAAIRTYDPKRGTFNTNLHWRILGAISDQHRKEHRDRLRGMETFGELNWAEAREQEQPPDAADLDALPGLMASLPDRERLVMVRRMRGDTLENIGVELGICKERVRQLRQRALQVLRRRYNARGTVACGEALECP